MSKGLLQFAIGGIVGSIATFVLAPVLSNGGSRASEGEIVDLATRSSFDRRASESVDETVSAQSALALGAAMVAEPAEADPAAVLLDAVALSDPGERRRALLRAGKVWARSDPRAALAEASTLPPDLRAAYLASVTAEWANLDADDFLTYAEGSTAVKALVGGLERLIASDPERVSEIAARLPDAGAPGLNPVRAMAIQALAERDPVAALSHVERLRPGQAYDSMSPSVLTAYAREYPDAALAWLDSVNAPSLIERAAVIRGIALADFDRGYELAADASAMSSLLQDMSFADVMVRDAEQAAQVASWLLERRDSRANRMLEQLASTWAQRAPDHVVDWVIDNAAAIQPPLARVIAESIATRDFESALSHVDRLPVALQDAWIAQIARPYAEKDPIGALDWVARYQGRAVYEDAHAQVVMHAAASAPELMAQALQGFAPALQAAAAPRIASAWAAQDPEAAAEWVLSLEGAAADSAVGSVVSQWMQSAPQAAIRWAMALPRGAARDGALSSVVSSSYGKRVDPRPILNEIDSEEARRFATMRAVSTTTPDIARELLSSLTDDPELGQWARRSLEALGEPGR